MKIATAQFPVSANIEKNFNYMVRLINQSQKAEVELIHFPECCLGGYASLDFKNWDNYNWDILKRKENEILTLAKKKKIGIIYGSNDKLGKNNIKNSLKYVSYQGKLAAQYDKRFCTKEDLKNYQPGKSFATFDFKGFKCGMLICYDVRFPELYREYRKMGIQILFQSFYNARAAKKNIHTTIMRATLQARAATNYFYISAANSSGYYQSWPSVFILPDGTIQSSCHQHKTGIISNVISQGNQYYDASGDFRNRAMSGILYSE